ncbi:MAG: hypothetical protein ABJA02_09385 [Acidobacteriota bacterium]
MVSKIYLGVLAVSTALMAFFTYYSWSWLQSIGQPSTAVAGYNYNDNIAWTLLIVSTLALAILGNVILWLTRRAWALWATLLYFAVFVLLRYIWLDQALFHFKKENGLWEGSFSIGPLFGAIVVIIAAVFVFSDQFAVLQLQRKMFPLAADHELTSIPEPDSTPNGE